jgi:hypothetical protein
MTLTRSERDEARLARSKAPRIAANGKSDQRRGVEDGVDLGMASFVSTT